MDESADFQHVTPALRIQAGAGSLGQLLHELDRLKSRRAVVICGSTLGREGSPLDAVRATLGERLVGTFTGVMPHSPVPSVAAAAELMREARADAVIAVGGGSAIVTARAASILLAEPGDVQSLATSFKDGKLVSPRLNAPKLPQLVIPTTPTTAIAKAGSALLEPSTHARLALFDPKTRAQSIFIHPEMLGSAPLPLIVSASVNTFAMSIEGLMSRKSDPIADGQLMHALRLCSSHLSTPEKLNDAQARSDLVIAALLCGQGTDHSGAGMTTVLGHAIGAHFDIENGLVNAIVLPKVLQFNASAARHGIQKIAAALGLAGGDLTSVIAHLRALFVKLNIPAGLRETGVTKADLPQIATRAMGDWFLKANPRPVKDEQELVALMEDAW